MLLCAGLGTRLRPLTDERPKPLVPVLGRPLASYALERLAAAGVRHVVANAHHLAEQILPTLGPFAQRLHLAFDVSYEATLLGTGGGIKKALPLLGDAPFVVFNGDVLAAPDLAAARALHERSGARITMVLREDPRAERLGAIEVDDEGRVQRILGEGPEPSRPVRRCLFTGIYVLSPSVRDELPDEGCIVRHTLRRLLARGEVVAGLVDAGPWYDLGTVESYASVNLGLLEGSIAFPGVDPPFEARWVDPLARIATGVRLGRCIAIGARAQVQGEGKIERAIVWEGAIVQAPLSGLIATTEGRRVPFASAPGVSSTPM